MQSLDNANPASAPPTDTASLNDNQATALAAAPTDALPAPPTDHTSLTASIVSAADLDVLSSLLTAHPFPPSPLPPLSTSAPRLDSRLVHYQNHPQRSHDRRLNSTLTPVVELTSSLYPTTHSLLSNMSHADLLRVHLDDMSLLVQILLEAVGSAGAEAALSVLDRVIVKQRAIDEVTQSLAAHQQRQQRIEAVKHDIQLLDQQLIQFASTLSTQQLALSSLLAPANTHSSSPLPSRLRHMSVASLVSYAQRLSAVSFAPSDVTERKGMSNARPPAPLESEMAASVLQLTPDEMRVWMEARRGVEMAAGDKAEAAEERKEAMSMPTVAEVESARASAAAAVSGGVEKRTGIAAVASAPVRRAPPPVAPAAASLLDLDLNPDMDESDEDEDDDSDPG